MKKVMLSFIVIFICNFAVANDASDKTEEVINTISTEEVAFEEMFTVCSDYADFWASLDESFGESYWPSYFSHYGHCLKQTGIQ